MEWRVAVGFSQEIVVPVLIFANLGEKCGENVPMVIRRPGGAAIVGKVPKHIATIRRTSAILVKIPRKLFTGYLLKRHALKRELFIAVFITGPLLVR